jgi:hypothetical protein
VYREKISSIFRGDDTLEDKTTDCWGESIEEIEIPEGMMFLLGERAFRRHSCG